MTIEEVLKSEGKYVGPTVGCSMRPMLKEGRDTVVICAKKDRLRALDVALYKRGDAYVLHRVIEPTEYGYITLGDNCYATERVKEEDVLGVLTEFFRKNKHIVCTEKRYLRYVGRRIKTYPLRTFFMRIKRKMKSLLKGRRRNK